MKRTVKILALFLLFALLFSLAACSSYTTAMEYGETKLSVNLYRYWLSSYKAQFLRSYTDMKDTDTFYDSILTDNITAEDFLNRIVRENVKRNLVAADWCRQYGLSLPESTLSAIDAYVEELTKEFANSSRRQMNQQLQEYGINTELLREAYVLEEQVRLVYSYLYGKNGPFALTEADYQAYFEEQFVRVRHIYVNTAYVYETADDGSYVVDTDGNVVTRELTEEEQAEKAKTVAAIDAQLASGADFETVYKTYSEEQYYENGYYLTRQTEFIDEVVTAAFALEMGESVKVESPFGIHYLLRLPLNEGAYNDEANADFFDGFKDTVKEADFLARLDEAAKAVTVREEELAPYSIRNVPANYAY